MPSIGQENLETVMIDFFGARALRSGDFDAAAALLHPDVAWRCAKIGSATAAKRCSTPFAGDSTSAARSTRSSSPAAASRSCWVPAARASARWEASRSRARSSTLSPFVTAGSCASTTIGAGTKRLRQPASPRMSLVLIAGGCVKLAASSTSSCRSASSEPRRVTRKSPRWHRADARPAVGYSGGRRPVRAQEGTRSTQAQA
jgi:hypothetical protein